MKLSGFIKKNKTSVKELAEYLECSPILIYLVMSGKRNFSIEKMEKLNRLDGRAFPMPDWMRPGGLSS